MPTPAPTELLNEDIKRLEESNRQIVVRIDGLEKSFQDMSKQFISFRSRVNTILAITGTVGLVVLGSAWTVWNGSGTLQRELGRTEAIVSGLDKRFDELKAVGEKLNRVSEDLARLQGRLDRDGSSPAPKSR
jgi:hypothetical protein